MVPAGAQAQLSQGDVQAALKSTRKLDREILAFYQARGNRPLWVRGSALSPAAERLLDRVGTANLDGLDPGRYRPRDVASALRKASSGSPKDLARAELLLSQTFAAYARDVRRPREIGMVYVDKVLAPSIPSSGAILRAAAAAPSLEHYVKSSGWMHPVYGQLREAIGDHQGSQGQLLRLNLERARALPTPGRRHVLVDAAAARLWMYENGTPVGSMRVVVGKADNPTPMMAGLIRYTMVNPYWNIPPDLVKDRIAPKMLTSGGLAYLKEKRYEILSDWSDTPKVLSPAKIDWNAVASGAKELPVRQRPGKDNAMGKMKFMFPNEQGIYLHDTPDKQLFTEEARLFSAGCVRLEDAPRLAKWLYGKPLAPKAGKPEQRVDLPEPVPVLITYLTAAPEGSAIVVRKDIYNRDVAQMAYLQARGLR